MTGESKNLKRKREKEKKQKAPAKSEHFLETGSIHALIRCDTLFWNCSESAVDIADAASHEERLKGALLAV